MKDMVMRLAYTRDITAAREKMLAEAEADLHNASEWKHAAWARESLQQAKERQKEAEAEVREQALGIYAETGDKKPHPAVPIKMYTVLEYEEVNALGYAREHLPKALKLIKRTFEKAAKVLKLDFVTITQEPRATIARDLSKYLPED